MVEIPKPVVTEAPTIRSELLSFLKQNAAMADVLTWLAYLTAVDMAPRDASQLLPSMSSWRAIPLAASAVQMATVPASSRFRGALDRLLTRWPPAPDAVAAYKATVRHRDARQFVDEVLGRHEPVRGLVEEAFAKRNSHVVQALHVATAVHLTAGAPVTWPIFVDDGMPFAARRRELLARLASLRGTRGSSIGWEIRTVSIGRDAFEVRLFNFGIGFAEVKIELPTGVVLHSSLPKANAAACAALFDIVNEPTDAELAAHLPMWFQPQHLLVLQAFQSFVAAAATDPVPQTRIAWEILMNPFTIRARRQKRRAKGQGWLKGSEVDPSQLIYDDSPEVSDQDRLLGARLRGYYRGDTADAVLALVGHPAVVDGAGNPIKVERATVRVALTDDADGAVRIGFWIDDDEVTAEQAAKSVCLLVDGPSQASRLRVAAVDERTRALAAAAIRGNQIAATSRPELERIVDQVADGIGQTLALPASLAGELVPTTAKLVIRLARDDGLQLRAQVSVVVGEGAGFLVPGEGAAIANGLKEGKRVRYERQLDAERFEAERLMALLRDPADVVGGEDPFTTEAHNDAALELLRRVQASGYEVVWRDERRVVISPMVAASGLRVRVTSVRTWLGLDGEVEIDGETVSLARLLAAVREQRRYVAVGNDRFSVIDASLRDALVGIAGLAAEAEPETDQAAGGKKSKKAKAAIEVSLAAAPALDVLANAGAVFDEGAMWRQLRTRLEDARTVGDEPPRGLRAELRPYQRQGLRFLRRLAAFGTGGVLADDMGLGKTVQAIGLLLDRQNEGPALVVAPTSLIFNWQRELERFAPGLRVHILNDADDRKALVSKLKKKDVLVVSYGLLDSDVFAEVTFATAVFDEAQAIKNAETRRAKICRDVNAELKIALSGTPLENRLSELWSLFQVVCPGLFGSAERFRQRFVLPIERDGSETHRQQLAMTLRPFLLRRTKHEVLTDLPALTQQLIDVEPSPEARRFYDALRTEILDNIDDGSDMRDRRFRVLAGLTRLRLCCCHPVLVEPSYRGPSAKLDAAVSAVEQVRTNGHKALVFSQFVKFLDLIEPALADAGIRTLRLDGSTPEAERRKRVDAFQNGEADVFLLSLKAGGAGLNLTAADVVIHLDPWWNPAVEAQAIARAHRMGRVEPVTAMRFIVRGTIEEAILKLHDDKRELVDSVLAGTGAGASLSLDEIATLLRTPHAQ